MTATAQELEECFERLRARFPSDALALEKHRKFEEQFFEALDRWEQELAQFDSRFTREEILGEGWFGTVHLAFDKELQRKVAIKTPHPGTPRTALARFKAEAIHAAKLNHPNIVQVFDFLSSANSCFIVYQYIEGAVDLSEYRTSNELTMPQRLSIVEQIARALEHAHASGLVHRDVKPENILIVDNHAWLTDFGLASSEDLLYRAVNMQVGTRGYMSPEQMRGEQVSYKSDVYSLGRVLQSLLECNLPVAKSVRELAKSCLEPEPANRPTATEFANTLSRIRRKPRQRTILLISIIALPMAIALAVAWRASSREAKFQDLLSKTIADESLNNHEQEQLLRDLLIQAEHAGDATRLSRHRPGKLELRKQASELKAELAKLEMRLLPRTKKDQDRLLLAKAIVADADNRHEDALSLLASFNDPTAGDLRLRYLQVKGNSSYSLRRWEDAAECYREVAVLAPTTNNIILAAQSAMDIDDTQYAKSIVDQALAAISSSTDLRSDLSLARDRAALMACLGSVHRLSGDPHDAETCYQQAFALLDDLAKQSDEFKFDRALALYNIGVLQNENDQALEAEESLSQSEKSLREISTGNDGNDALKPLALSLTRLSNARQRLGKLSVATENATEAVNMLRLLSKSQPELQLELAVALNELGNCSARSRNYEVAMSVLKEAESVFRSNSIETTSSKAGLASALANEVYVLQQTAMYSKPPIVSQEALDIADEAGKIFEQLREAGRLNRVRTLELARLHVNVATMLTTANPPNVEYATRALQYLRKAENILADSGGSILLKANCDMNVAVAMKAIDPRSALPYFQSAIDGFSKLDTLEGSESLALALHNRAICYSQFTASVEELKQSYNAAKEDAGRAIEIYDRLLAAGQTHVENDRARSVQLLNQVISVLEMFK